MLAGLEQIGEQSRATFAMRLVIYAILIAVYAMSFGWAVGLGFAGAAMVEESLDFSAGRAGRLKASRPRTWAVLRLGALLAASLAWTAFSGSLWASGEPTLRFSAILLLSMMLVRSAAYAVASKEAALASAAAPAAALTALPFLFFGGFANPHAGFIAVSACLPFAYVVKLVRETIRQSEALRAANLQLQAQEQALREQTERAQRANAAKSRFLAMMSHELRTPMNGVLGMARAISQTKLTPQQSGYVGMLVRSGDGLMAILNDLLDLSKVEAGKLDLEEIGFDLHELGECVRDLWTEAASAKGVSLLFETDFDRPFWVTGDPTRLRQILVNLVSNALKFTPQGSVRLKIDLEDEAEGAARLRFEVSDTGIGLTPEQASRLFQPFVQADASTTRQFGGTGLGLSICQELAQLMNSQIAIESAPGEGSRFFFTLNLPRSAAPAAKPDEQAAGGLEGVRVLVADDNPINLAVACALLEVVGVEVTTAPDGRAALAALKAGRFDAVLMDVHMPVMSGVEAVRAIRAGEAGPKDIPVIALTADAMAGVDAALLGHGFDAVEAKPITPAGLLATLAGLLEPPASAAAPAAIAGAA